MSCAVELDLTAYLDGELPTGRRQELESHLRECRSCQATAQLLERSVVKLASLPGFEPSRALRAAVLSQIAQQPSSFGDTLRQFWHPRLLVPSAGLAAAALLAVLSAGKGPRDAHEHELGASLEMIEDYEVLGLTSTEDLETVQHLHELEGRP
jgi:anti-sigma factor RsiW